MILKVGHSRWDALKYEAQKAILVHELAAHGGCVAATARALGLNAPYIFRLKKDFGLDPAPRRGWTRTPR